MILRHISKPSPRESEKIVLKYQSTGERKEAANLS
jgi:hypothetical protein